MIAECVVTTLDPEGHLNIAPMGPVLADVPAHGGEPRDGGAGDFGREPDRTREPDRDPAERAFDRFTLRPFRTSQTYRNLRARPEGVLHVTDDVLLIARAALGGPGSPDGGNTPHLPAAMVRGRVLADACRWVEFHVTVIDDSRERTELVCEAVAHGRRRDFFGFHRARHAVLEAAILATRLHLPDIGDVRAELNRLAVVVEKTAGPREREAFTFVRDWCEARLPPR